MLVQQRHSGNRISISNNYMGGEVSPYYTVGSDCVLYHAYWDGTADDHSSYGNDGVVTDGSFGDTGLTFNGSTTKIAITPSDSSLQLGTNDWTCLIWILSTSATYQRLLDFRNNANPINNGFVAFNIRYDTTPKQIICGTYFGGNQQYAVTAYPSITAQWSLMGIHIDRDVGGIATQNGVFIDSPFGIPLGPTDTNDQSQYDTYEIGGVTVGVPANGIIGELYVFNTYKTPTEALALYTSTKSRYGL